jgi:hypothetical protein
MPPQASMTCLKAIKYAEGSETLTPDPFFASTPPTPQTEFAVTGLVTLNNVISEKAFCLL